jgi:hypothetical protein
MDTCSLAELSPISNGLLELVIVKHTAKGVERITINKFAKDYVGRPYYIIATVNTSPNSFQDVTEYFKLSINRGELAITKRHPNQEIMDYLPRKFGP